MFAILLIVLVSLATLACLVFVVAQCVSVDSPFDRDLYEQGGRLQALLVTGCLYWGDLSPAEQQACRYFIAWSTD